MTVEMPQNLVKTVKTTNFIERIVAIGTFFKASVCEVSTPLNRIFYEAYVNLR